ARVVEGCYDLLLIRAQAADPAEGLRILDRAKHLHPAATAAYHRRRADCLARAGDLAGRDRELRAAAQFPPVTPLDHFLNGRELVFRRQFAEAVRPLRRAIQLDPDQTSAHLLLAVAHLYDPDTNRLHEMNRLSEAAASLTACIKSHQETVGLYLLRAQV